MASSAGLPFAGRQRRGRARVQIALVDDAAEQVVRRQLAGGLGASRAGSVRARASAGDGSASDCERHPTSPPARGCAARGRRGRRRWRPSAGCFSTRASERPCCGEASRSRSATRSCAPAASISVASETGPCGTARARKASATRCERFALAGQQHRLGRRRVAGSEPSAQQVGRARALPARAALRRARAAA